MDPVAALMSLGGAAELAALTRLKVGKRQLHAAVDRGMLIRARRGCYALPDADPNVVAEVAWRGRLTCVSAIGAWSLPILDPVPGLHLAIPASRNHGSDHLALPASITAHHVGDVEAARRLAGALDIASRCVSRESQLVMVDAALSRRLIARAEVAAFEATSRRRRAFLLRHASRLSQSPLESLTRLVLTRAHLAFHQQVVVGGVGRVDFIVEGRVIVEVDGRTTHDDPVQFAEDRRRDRAAVALGYRVLRFTYADVTGAPDRLLADIRAALRAPWLPVPPRAAWPQPPYGSPAGQ
ncbi:endonuclease domain-containing protein [Demequina soli]|uniref:endonuclease domain-containing protein n=1 Tax=Demequina soli TaxID=1638987 RepID=UPI000780FE55|nr:DUF559 domain-containing protein [Demequina soli]